MNNPYNGRHCKDCVHSSEYKDCRASSEVDPFDGSAVRHLNWLCFSARGLSSTCGPEGKLYEAKE